MDVFYKKNDKRKYHVVTILDKERTLHIVYKYYGIHKQWWHYEIEPMFSFNSAFRIGLYYRK
jgi:hypothetical protein